MPTVEEELQEALNLIRAKRYEEALLLLMSLDHPKAQEWIERVNELIPTGDVESRIQAELKANQLPLPQDPWSIIFHEPNVPGAPELFLIFWIIVVKPFELLWNWHLLKRETTFVVGVMIYLINIIVMWTSVIMMRLGQDIWVLVFLGSFFLYLLSPFVIAQIQSMTMQRMAGGGYKYSKRNYRMFVGILITIVLSIIVSIYMYNHPPRN